MSLDGDVPCKVWLGEHADYEKLKIFRCTTYYHVSEGKLEARAKKAIFFGYASGVKGNCLWCLEHSKLIISRNVTFDEKSNIACSNDTMPNGDDIKTVKS